MTTENEEATKAALLKLIAEKPNVKVMPMDIGDLVLKMNSSAFNIILWYQHESPLELAKHPELAMQIGIGMSLDKPIIVLVRRGETAPSVLVRAADAVIDDLNFDDASSWQPKLQAAIEEMADKLDAVRKESSAGSTGESGTADNADGGEAR